MLAIFAQWCAFFMLRCPFFHLGAPLIVRFMASCLEALDFLSRDHDVDDSDIHGHNVDGDGADMRICKISIVLMSQYRWC